MEEEIIIIIGPTNKPNLVGDSTEPRFYGNVTRDALLAAQRAIEARLAMSAVAKVDEE